MKAMVTGGAGFIGSNLAHTLFERGIDLVVLDNFSSSRFENIVDLKGDVISLDAAEAEWEKLPKCDVIFHEQAITDTTVMDQKQMMAQNTETFRKLLQFTIKKKIPLIYASSAGVYGNEPPPQRETGTLKPANIYGYSKLQMDFLARAAFAEARSPIVGLRYFNVFGPREKYKGHAASMIYQLAEQVQSGKRPRVFEFGEQERDHIYVKDVVEANLRAWEAGTKGVYNVGTGAPTSFNRLIDIIRRVLSSNLETEYFPNPYSFYQNRTQADVQLAQREIGFKAQWSIEAGIEDYLKLLYGLNPAHRQPTRSDEEASTAGLNQMTARKYSI